ncbi:hypothetical protein [Actinocrinis sp.]|uniref:hypothetical protein n=1 Tax=Actinocrinis sp. TaxID=1920516 RepID=UPI002D38A714|nr:hypothetical protein [Actinocrinis sp.]HZP52486.1 hypothetical protein [Actinocrinis sp.]
MTVTIDSAAATRAAARRGAVRTVLNTVEWVIFRGDGLAVARNNAWAAVQEDRARAKARAEASTALLEPHVEPFA